METLQFNPKAAFGKRLKEVRMSKGLSQEKLASLAALDRTYVSSCERGRRNVSLENIYKLSAALGVEPKELLPTPNTNN